MNSFIVITKTLFIFIIAVCQPPGIGSKKYKNTNFYLNTMQTIRKFGYPAESHVIETADGYLLEMHRIPPNKESSNTDKPPVFIQHGLFGSSMDFFLLGTKDVLPFLLADLGFDVWLGNVRGNTFSRAHVTLFPDDKKFWNFTWHESSVYDVPAQIDFICNHTNHDKIIYIGHSMGTTIFFVMTSVLPEYNNKIELSLLLAAVAYVENIKSPLLRYLLPFSNKIKVLADLVSSGAFLPNGPLLKLFGKTFCELTNMEKKLCMNAIFLIAGSDPQEFDKDLLASFINHYPSGYSAKGLHHYLQLAKSGKFRQYDYGKKGNRLEYGSSTPPDYNLSSITAPIYIYQGKNDLLSDLKDVHHLSKELKSLRRMRLIDYPKFSHIDFLISLDVKKLLYDTLLGDLMSHLNDSNRVY